MALFRSVKQKARRIQFFSSLEHTKTLHIYELTMPSMSNIEARHQEKTNKYSHFLTDITTYKTSLNCFEVTSTGFVSSRNVKTLRLLHKLMRKDLKKSVFMNNLNSLAWYGSYQIWLTRNDPVFTIPPSSFHILATSQPPLHLYCNNL